MKNKYVAIIGDIVNSHDINTKDRNDIQIKFRETLEFIDEKYSDDIVSKFDIVSGDGFRGLLGSIENLMNIIKEMELRMYPTKLRFGVGIGELSTDIDPDKSSYLDGTSYHVATRMLKNIELNENSNSSYSLNIMINSIFAENLESEIFDLINIILSLCTEIKNNWTKIQVDMIKCFIDNDENQIKTAKFIDKKQSTVSRSLNSSKYYSYRNALMEVQKKLEKCWKICE